MSADPPPGSDPGPDPDVILTWIGRRCLTRLDCDSAFVAMWSAARSLTLLHATDDRTRDLALVEFTLGEGPCHDSAREARAVVEHDLDRETADRRWPLWAPAAREVGLLSVASYPIRAGALVVGTLTTLASHPTSDNPTESAVGQRLADAAFLGLLDLRAGLATGHTVGVTGAHPLQADVHRAAGMVMAQTGLTIDDAMARLRAHAFGSQRPIAEVAADVIARRLRFDAEDATE